MKNKVGCRNLKMNYQTFNLRRQVISLVYEARELVDGLPRVEVRIVENQGARGGGNLLGRAAIDGVKHISITKDSFDLNVLRQIVFHELIHTLFGVGHDEKCPLMKSKVDAVVPKETVHKLFKKYAKKGGGQ